MKATTTIVTNQSPRTSGNLDFVAIFDADFLPPSDFLKKALPYFVSKEIGMVQTRWGHLNDDYSTLTKAQSLSLDAHLLIEQKAKSHSELFISFNGTAGIWRKDCILDSGGWQNTLAEDLDLSFRAQLKGWKFLFLDENLSPAEIPVQVSLCPAIALHISKAWTTYEERLEPWNCRWPKRPATCLSAGGIWSCR